MANQPTEEQLADINGILNHIQPILNTPIVFVRPVQGTQPYIDLAGPLDQVQQLAIGDDIFPIELHKQQPQGNIISISFGNQWRLRSQPVNYGGQQNPQHFRRMIVTTFAGYATAGQCGAMFAQIVNGMSGPQAQLMLGPGQHQWQRLFVVDEDTAAQLNYQSMTWGDHQSSTYQLVTAAYLLLSLANTLNMFYDQDVDQEIAENMRTNIHLLAAVHRPQLYRSMSADYINRIAIVRTRNMPALIPQHWPRAQPFMLPLPAMPEEVPPFEADNIDMEELFDDWEAFIHPLLANQDYNTDWAEQFGRFATVENSIEFLDIVDNNQPVFRAIHLPNGQDFNILITRKPNDTYELHSPFFTDSTNFRYRLRQAHPWPAWTADRYQGNLWVPLHSHGLAGSYQGPVIVRGNNGCQVMSVLFGDQLVQQRLYFINRHMAVELRNAFEFRRVLTGYQRWFNHLLPLSRRICDARCLSRQEHDDADPELLESVRNFADQLHQISDRLYENYCWLVRLEQIWKYSVLAPHMTAAVDEHREDPIRSVKINAAVYGLGRAAKLQSLWPEDQVKEQQEQE